MIPSPHKTFLMVHMLILLIQISGRWKFSRKHIFCTNFWAMSIDTTVSVYNFQVYWQGANEAISSSYSRLHFGHYKATSFDKNLSNLHAAKLSACAKKGIPLHRWGVRLTVLLEKTWGNNNIHKCKPSYCWKAILIITWSWFLLNGWWFQHKIKAKYLSSAFPR